MADLLAKSGTTLAHWVQVQLRTYQIPIPAVNLKNTIKYHFYPKWKTMWKNDTKCRQTKLWFEEPDKNLSRDILQRSKVNLSSSSLVTTIL
jgi:hypothetical protein